MKFLPLRTWSTAAKSAPLERSMDAMVGRSDSAATCRQVCPEVFSAVTAKSEGGIKK